MLLIINQMSIQYMQEKSIKECVNHPNHYASGNIECIDAMVECFGKKSTEDFCLLNAFKYLWRCNIKENKNQDIEKANWYLNKYLELERS